MFNKRMELVIASYLSGDEQALTSFEQAAKEVKGSSTSKVFLNIYATYLARLAGLESKPITEEAVSAAKEFITNYCNGRFTGESIVPVVEAIALVGKRKPEIGEEAMVAAVEEYLRGKYISCIHEEVNAFNRIIKDERLTA